MIKSYEIAGSGYHDTKKKKIYKTKVNTEKWKCYLELIITMIVSIYRGFHEKGTGGYLGAQG